MDENKVERQSITLELRMNNIYLEQLFIQFVRTPFKIFPLLRQIR